MIITLIVLNHSNPKWGVKYIDSYEEQKQSTPFVQNRSVLSRIFFIEMQKHANDRKSNTSRQCIENFFPCAQVVVYMTSMKGALRHVDE